MPQFDFGNLESPLSGSAFVNSNMEPWRDALHSGHSGNARPSYATAGMRWINTTTNPWVLNIFDGSADIVEGYIDIEENAYIPANAGNAAQVGYDNEVSGLTAENLQEAIDELQAGKASGDQGDKADTAVQPSAGQIVKQTTVFDSTILTVNQSISLGASAPSSTEGLSFINLTIPDKASPSNLLYVDVIVNYGNAINGSAGAGLILAFFLNAATAAFDLASEYNNFSNNAGQSTITKRLLLPGTVSGDILRIRAGRNGGSSIIINGTQANVPIFGAKTSIVFTEVRA